MTPLPELTSCQVDPCRGAQAFAGHTDRGQQVFQGVVELRVLQGVVPQSSEQLPLSALRASWGTGGHSGENSVDVYVSLRCVSF